MRKRASTRSNSSEPRQKRDDDALILSDELDIDLISEFPGLKVENENVPVREDEEVAEYKQEPFGRVVDPVRIYLKEMGSFSLLTRGRGSRDCQED